MQILIEAVQGNAYTGEWDSTALYLYNERDLRKFAKAVNEADASISEIETFKLASDVVLSEEWAPIGQKAGTDNKFTKTFDGENHVVSEMKVTSETVGRDSDFCFTHAEEGAVTTKNNFDGFGAFFGAIQGATIKNLIVKGNVECDNAGGIVARSYKGTIKNCNSYVDVTGVRKAGGIVGMTSSGVTTITNCVNYGDVDSVVGNNCFDSDEHKTDRASAAGIIGYLGGNTKTCEITECTNEGSIGSNDCEFAGGIVAYATAGVGKTADKVSDSANNGNVLGNTNVGGIIGIVLNGNSNRKLLTLLN